MFSVTTPVDPQVARLKSHLAGLRCKRTAPLSTRGRAENYAAQVVNPDHADRVALLGSVAEGLVTYHPGAIKFRPFTPAQWRRLKKRHNRTRNRTQGTTPVHTAIDETSQMSEILKSAGAPA